MEQRLNISSAKSILWLGAGLVMTMTWAIGATGWTRDMNVISLVGLGVILVGALLARSMLPAVVAHLFSVVIGVAWSFWVTSRLLPENYTWLQRWQTLVLRLNHWYDQAVQGGTSYDNLMFILQMGVIVWGTGYLIIWFLLRSGKVWQAIMPGGLVLLINLYYAPEDITPWFLAYLLLALLLAIRFNLFTQEVKWRSEGVFFRPDIGFDFLRAGFVFSVLVIALAWVLPPAVDAKSLGLFDDFQGNWHDFQQEWNRLYADLNYRNPGAGDVFGKSLTLGGPRYLTNEPVLDVRVEGPGRYWRAAVYDEYDGLGWQSNDNDSASFGAGESPALAVLSARLPVTQTYTVYRDGVTMLYALGQPIALDRPAKATFSALSQEQARTITHWWGQGDPWTEEITYLRSNAAVNKGESYVVVSASSQATIQQLAAAGTNYPAWINEKYLAIPASVSPRTRDLARQITASFDNPFDKARAVESYLRTTLKYNEKVEAPPPGVDRVDYVLFETKEAYCDYYASAMVVMLRSLGIPARFVAGFAQGTYDAELDIFHVISADAHSWVEVYFPRYGWIEFEPTAAQPGITRRTQPNPAASLLSNAIPDELSAEIPPDRPGNIPIDEENILPLAFDIPWFGGRVSIPRVVFNGMMLGMGLLVLLAVTAGAGWWWNEQRRRTMENIFGLYQHMLRLARWMGLPIRPWQTPFEHAALLQRRLPAHQEEVGVITSQYVYQTFSPVHAREPAGGGPAAPPAARVNWPAEGLITYESNAAWYRLQPQMIKAAIKAHLRLPRWRLRR